MILHLAKQRFLDNIFTFRFSASFILSVVLFVASTLILAQDYTERLSEYRDAVRQNEDTLKEIFTFSRLRVGISRPPSPLAIVCEGIEKYTPNSFTVGFDQTPKIADETGVRNPLLRIFTVFDLATVVEVILSLLAILVAYNSISGDKERGTLKMVLANKVPRHVVLLGNCLGSMATVVLPLAVGTLISLLLIQLNPVINLSLQQYLSLGVLFVVAVLFLGVFYMAGMFLSARLMNSSTVLIMLLVGWVVVVLILPNCAIYLARHIVPIPDKAVVDVQAQALEDQWKTDMNEYADQHPWPWREIGARLGRDFSQQDGWNFNNKVESDRRVYNGSWPFAYRVKYALREVMDWYEAGSIYGHNRRMNYEDRIWRLYQDYQTKLEQQSRLSRIICLISPSWAFYHASSYLTNTGEAGFLGFVDQASRYRNEIIGYMKNSGGLDSYRLFTFKPIDQFLSAREVASIIENQGENALKDMIDYEISPLNLQEMPRFRYSRPDPLVLAWRALPEISVLLILNILFFVLAWVAFLRADVR